jgi:hypothetical protein
MLASQGNVGGALGVAPLRTGFDAVAMVESSPVYTVSLPGRQACCRRERAFARFAPCGGRCVRQIGRVRFNSGRRVRIFPSLQPSRDGLWPRSSGIRTSCTRASASSSPTGMTNREHRRFLQLARHSGAVDQGTQGRDQMDQAVVPFLCRRRPPSAPCPRLKLRQFYADIGNAQDGGAVVADQPAREAHQDRREGRRPWPICDLWDVPPLFPNGWATWG